MFSHFFRYSIYITFAINICLLNLMLQILINEIYVLYKTHFNETFGIYS